MEKDLKSAAEAASQPATLDSDSATVSVKKTAEVSQSDGIMDADVVKTKPEKVTSGPARSRVAPSNRIVTADYVQAEEVPTIPIGSLETINSLHAEVSVHSVASTRAVSMPAPLVVQSSEYRRSPGEWLQVWVDGVRPSYLPLALLPALLGTVLAWTQSISVRTPLGHFHIVPFVGMLISLLL